MQFIDVQPSEVITTRDFPVYSQAVLEKYFDIYVRDEEEGFPPVPLIEVKRFLPYFNQRELAILQEFLALNPQAKYFLMNGSHRTTAANLTGKPITGMVLETEDDIETARQIKSFDQPYEHGLLDTIEANIKEMVEHFNGTDKFETVEHKTARMVDEKVIPDGMIECYLFKSKR